MVLVNIFYGNPTRNEDLKFKLATISRKQMKFFLLSQSPPPFTGPRRVCFLTPAKGFLTPCLLAYPLAAPQLPKQELSPHDRLAGGG
jgi:hypothetical protein